MTMYQGRSGNGHQVARAFEDERRQTEQFAEQLYQQATLQQRRAIEGLIALPAAIALRIAATTLRVVTSLARGFEVMRLATEASEEYRAERERADIGRPAEPPRA